MNDRDTIKTYILYCFMSNEYYCGRTKNMKKRMTEHIQGQGWFAYNHRFRFKLIIELIGDYEKEIKRFGVKRFVEMMRKNIKGVSLS